MSTKTEIPSVTEALEILMYGLPEDSPRFAAARALKRRLDQLAPLADEEGRACYTAGYAMAYLIQLIADNPKEIEYLEEIS